MKDYGIFEDENSLVIVYRLHGFKEEYSIPKVRLDELEKTNSNLYEDSHHSFWIVHLLEKKWVSKDMLYELAGFINKLHPASNIDWFEIFKVVEKKYYHEAIYKNEFEDRKLSGMDSVMALIEIGREEFGKPEIEDGISHVIRTRLKEIGIH